MSNFKWTRRRFLGSAAAIGTLPSNPVKGLWAWPESPVTQSQAHSPEITAGHLVPLLEDSIARPLRYRPEGGGFSVHNGTEFFNRPLYGANIPFRADGGDRPEFSLYLPGHGGNLRLGIASETGEGKWLFEFASVITRYIDGRLSYELSDSLLGGSGLLRVEALTTSAGLWIEVTGTDLPSGLNLTWAFGGVSGRKGARGGDIGCEKEPVAEFFQLRPEECAGNTWTLSSDTKGVAKVERGKIRLRVETPPAAQLRLSDAALWNAGWTKLWSAAESSPSRPLLVGQTALTGAPLRLRLMALAGTQLPNNAGPLPDAQDAAAFDHRRFELRATARRVSWKAPDDFLNGMSSALGIAADALWDEAQGCVMHGAVAWRVPLAGWRGPYALDVLGRHDRMRRHLRHWIARQNTSPVMNGSGGVPTNAGFSGIVEATGAPDAGSRGARTENLLHSSGDVSHNHYDMNLVFFDALLRHLRWTGDLAFAREVWPALELHAAWERRLFRRDYGSGGAPLPLYEAYAAIWASDNLQYNGGGAAHSSAYNVFLNRRMAELARLLGQRPEVATAYDAEADAIERAMHKLLWMPERGAMAESREWLGERRLSEDPALWTVYHTIDSEVTTAKESWQMAAERLRVLRKIPITGDGVPADAGWQIGCSDWQPYIWSLTLLVLAENLATALALFQSGMAEEGYGLLRGSLLDAGYRGLCPGNFPMSLQLDPHRQESQRDFGDPIGCASRALIEGLWGVQPDLPAGRLTLRPQLPAQWEQAELHHPELDLIYRREADRESWQVSQRFAAPVAIRLELPARSVELPSVVVNGQKSAAQWVQNAVGRPKIVLAIPATSSSCRIELCWHGAKPVECLLAPIACTVDKPVSWPKEVQSQRIDDPQGCLQNGVARRVGRYTVFALQSYKDNRFWLPVELQIAEKRPVIENSSSPAPMQYDPVPIDSFFTGHAREALTRNYEQPRSGLCSLHLPEGLLGGWANFDVAAEINDAGLRNCGGDLKLPGGLRFATPAGATAPNCCYLSQWAMDRKAVRIPISGRARELALLFLGTTFPQATGSSHASVRVAYRDADVPATVMELRSPQQWWPVEQDYFVDDYLFRLRPDGAPQEPLPMRVDLQTARARQLSWLQARGVGGPIKGGSANVVRIGLEARRELAELEVRCNLYGVVMGVLGVTLGR